MKISAKTDYACKAILELSLHGAEEGPMQVKDIAKRQKIPIKFLVHILIQLKQLGYVDSTRGKNGGYVLNKQPFDVKLNDIVRHFEGWRITETVPKFKADVLETVWLEAQTSADEFLGKINFEDIRNRYLRQSKAISYDI